MHQKDVEVRPFDLHMAGNLVHEIAPITNSMNERCAHNFELLLSNMLHTEISVQCSSEVTLDRLKGRHDEHYYRTLLTTNKEKDSFAAFSVDRSLVDACLDLLCGGSGNPSMQLGSDFEPTPGEITILTKLTMGLLRCYEEVYSSLLPMKLKITSKSQDAEYEIKSSREAEYITRAIFHTLIGETCGEFTIDIPQSTIMSSGFGREQKSNCLMDSELRQTMTKIPLSVTAIIGQQQTSLRKVSTLKPGDIIPLGEPMDAEVFVEQKHLCKARVIAGSNRLMLQVTNDEKPQPDNQEDEPLQPQRRNRSRSSRSTIQTETPARARSESREARPNRKRTSTRGEK